MIDRDFERSALAPPIDRCTATIVLPIAASIIVDGSHNPNAYVPGLSMGTPTQFARCPERVSDTRRCQRRRRCRRHE